MPLKLYLGCATPPFHEQHQKVMGDVNSWVWVDKFINHPSVKQWDATNLTEVEDSSVDQIYASHLLEHISHRETLNILKHWHTKLVDGGKITLNVPDLLWACLQVVKLNSTGYIDGLYNTFPLLQNVFYGTQDHEGEYHKSGFTRESLYLLLEQSGFKDITAWTEFEAHDEMCVLAEATK